MPGQTVMGPIARNVVDLEYASRTMLDLIQESVDRQGEVLLPLPWKQVHLPEKLNVGYFVEFGAVKVRLKETRDRADLALDQPSMCESCHGDCKETRNGRTLRRTVRDTTA